MESENRLKFRPYYTPSPPSYLTGRTEIIEGPALTDSTYDLIDGTGLPTKEAILDIIKSQVLEYIGIAIARPFENAKILLQCQLIPIGLDPQQSASSVEDEEEEEEPEYFSEQQQPSHHLAERRTTDSEGYIHQNEADEATRPPWQIPPKVPPTMSSVLDAIWSTEGIGGSFKATNLSFCYNFLSQIIEGQITGLLGVFMGLPDPTITLDNGDSMSLVVNVAAAGITALFLAPLDIARTKIILTPLSEPRGILYTLKTLPSKLCPLSLVVPTLLDSCVPAICSRYLSILVEPISSLVQLFVTLPIETVLRRAQVSYSTPRKSVVHFGGYSGIFGTPRLIARQEGDGFFGLYRGWKVNAMGVLAVWGLSFVASTQERQTETEF